MKTLNQIKNQFTHKHKLINFLPYLNVYRYEHRRPRVELFNYCLLATSQIRVQLHVVGNGLFSHIHIYTHTFTHTYTYTVTHIAHSTHNWAQIKYTFFK